MIIAFRLKFMNLFFISYVFSVVMRVCVTYVGMRFFFFISADSYLVTLLSLAVTFPLSLCSDAGSAGWIRRRLSSPSPSASCSPSPVRRVLPHALGPRHLRTCSVSFCLHGCAGPEMAFHLLDFHS